MLGDLFIYMGSHAVHGVEGGQKFSQRDWLAFSNLEYKRNAVRGYSPAPLSALIMYGSTPHVRRSLGLLETGVLSVREGHRYVCSTPHLNAKICSALVIDPCTISTILIA